MNKGQCANGYEITVQPVSSNSTNYQLVHSPNNTPLLAKKDTVTVIGVDTPAIHKAKKSENIRVDLQCNSSRNMHLMASDKVIPSKKAYTHIHKGGWIFNGKSRSLVLPKGQRQMIWLVGVLPFDYDTTCNISITDA
jgi:hypothetical protein